MDRCDERSLLIAATRAILDGKVSPDLEALASRPLDWEWILRRAETEHLGALLHAVLSPLDIPAPMRNRLRIAWVNGRRQYLLGVEQLSQVLATFQRGGVPVIPLRGPALAELLYRDPAIRPFTDIDMLIPERHLPSALSLLSGSGYRHMEAGLPLSHERAWRHAASFTAEDPDALPIDLHWGLVDYPGGVPVTEVNHPEIWERAVRIEGPRDVRWGLCPEDFLMHLALHWAVHHALSGLIWQLDLALLIGRHGRTLDWNAVVERAERWRTRSALYFALQEVQKHFEVTVPPWVLTRLRPAGPRPAFFEWLRLRREERLERLDYLVPFLMMDRGSDLLRALASAAVPPANWLRCRYGTESVVGAYLAHYARMGQVCARTVRASLGRPH